MATGFCDILSCYHHSTLSTTHTFKQWPTLQPPPPARRSQCTSPRRCTACTLPSLPAKTSTPSTTPPLHRPRVALGRQLTDSAAPSRAPRSSSCPSRSTRPRRSSTSRRPSRPRATSPPTASASFTRVRVVASSPRTFLLTFCRQGPQGCRRDLHVQDSDGPHDPHGQGRAQAR